ncbi:MAG: phosphatidate cytidylyltransferase [Spirochaetales bacterium]|jgi:phosphatidate cytidylyltransferase|nr:phosphatidate cytidylyltransferase [Spirochaetales bacterium]
MKNLTARLLLGITAIPLLLLILFIPGDQYHLGLNILVVAAGFLGSREIARLLNCRGLGLNVNLCGFLGALPPAAALAALVFPGRVSPEALLLGAAVAVLLPLGLPAPGKSLESGVLRFAGSLAVLIYPGLFLSRIVALSGLTPSVPFILLFLALVFGNDSFAYFAGAALGKSNRGLFRVSPNKSWAGLIGGLAAAAAFALAFSLLFPELSGGVFTGPEGAAFLRRLCGLGEGGFRLRTGGGPGALIFLALITALAAVGGDLLESALKRGAGIKDSGRLLPGRGGVMDSLDSLLFSAPFYYYLIRFFYF